MKYLLQILVLGSFCSIVNAQASHFVSADAGSIFLFSKNENFITSNITLKYNLQGYKFGLSTGVGVVNKYSKNNTGLSVVKKTSNSFGIDLNGAYDIYQTNKLRLTIAFENRVFWEFYAFRSTFVLSNNEESYIWKGYTSWKSPFVQIYLGPKLIYKPFEGLECYAQFGFVLDNYDQFSTKFSTDFKARGGIGLGVSYQISFSKNNTENLDP